MATTTTFTPVAHNVSTGDPVELTFSRPTVAASETYHTVFFAVGKEGTGTFDAANITFDGSTAPVVAVSGSDKSEGNNRVAWFYVENISSGSHTISVPTLAGDNTVRKSIAAFVRSTNKAVRAVAAQTTSITNNTVVTNSNISVLSGDVVASAGHNAEVYGHTWGGGATEFADITGLSEALTAATQVVGVGVTTVSPSITSSSSTPRLAMSSIVIREQEGISVNDATIDPTPTTVITITKDVVWDGAVTATIDGSSISLTAINTTQKSFTVDIPDLLPGGAWNAIRPSKTDDPYTRHYHTLAVTDSDGTFTTQVEIAFDLSTAEDFVYSPGGNIGTFLAVSGAVAGDSQFAFWHTGNGVRDKTILGTTDAGAGYFAPITIPSQGRLIAYDVSGGVWLAAADTDLYSLDEPDLVLSKSQHIPDGAVYTNLALWSDEFGHSSWTKTRASVVFDPAEESPRRTGAWTLVEDGTASNTHYIEQSITPSASTVYTASVYVKASNRTQVAIALTGAGNSDSIVIFDVSTGQYVATSGAAPGGYGINEVALGSSWWRIYIYWTTTSTATMTMRVYAAASGSVTFSGGSQESLIIADAMLHTGATLQSYIETERATMASDKVLARSYITHNLVARSNTMSDAAWTKTRSSISGSIALNSNATGGWQSSTLYRLLEDTTASNTHFVANTADAMVGNPADLVSVRFLAQGDGTRNHVAVRVYGDSNSNYFEYVINLSAGSVYSSAVGGTGSLHSTSLTQVDTVSSRPVYEVTLRGWPTTTSDTAIYQIEFYDHNGTTTSYTGTGTNGVYVGKVHVWNGRAETPNYSETAASGSQPFAGTITTATINGISATVASANRSTVTVTLPDVDEFDDAGTHAATRWRVVQDLVIGDGVTTGTGAITFEPFYPDNFGTLVEGFEPSAPTGAAAGDDGYIRVLSGAGAVVAPYMSFAPSEESTVRKMVYDVSGGVWLAYTEVTAIPYVFFVHRNSRGGPIRVLHRRA